MAGRGSGAHDLQFELQTKCYGQSFDRRIALGLERQNEMLDTGIDVTPCAYREYTAEFDGPLVYQFKHCGLGTGEWKIETTGVFKGHGVATVDNDGLGTWEVDQVSSESGLRLQYWGTVRLTSKPQDDAKADIEPDQLYVNSRHGMATLNGKAVEVPLDGQGMTLTAKRTDKPCRHPD